MSEATLRESVERARSALQELHGALVDAVARDYELEHGPVSGTSSLLHAVAEDEFFAWLRPFSELIVALDDLLDAHEEIPPQDAAAVRAEIEEALDRGPGTFHDSYVAVLQRSPDVAAMHGQLRRATAGLPTTHGEDVAALLHARHRWAAARRKQRGPGA